MGVLLNPNTVKSYIVAEGAPRTAGIKHTVKRRSSTSTLSYECNIFGYGLFINIPDCTSEEQAGQMQVIWDYNDEDKVPELKFYPDTGQTAHWRPTPNLNRVIGRLSSFRDGLKEIAAAAIQQPTPLEVWQVWLQDEIPKQVAYDAELHLQGKTQQLFLPSSPDGVLYLEYSESFRSRHLDSVLEVLVGCGRGRGRLVNSINARQIHVLGIALTLPKGATKRFHDRSPIYVALDWDTKNQDRPRSVLFVQDGETRCSLDGTVPGSSVYKLFAKLAAERNQIIHQLEVHRLEQEQPLQVDHFQLFRGGAKLKLGIKDTAQLYRIDPVHFVRFTRAVAAGEGAILHAVHVHSKTSWYFIITDKKNIVRYITSYDDGPFRLRLLVDRLASLSEWPRTPEVPEIGQAFTGGEIQDD